MYLICYGAPRLFYYFHVSFFAYSLFHALYIPRFILHYYVTRYIITVDILPQKAVLLLVFSLRTYNYANTMTRYVTIISEPVNESEKGSLFII